MGIGNALNTYKICGRIDTLNPAILPSQDNSFLDMSLSYVSNLASKGLMLALAKNSVEFVRIMPKYGMPFLLHVQGRVCCSLLLIIFSKPRFKITDLVKLTL